MQMHHLHVLKWVLVILKHRFTLKLLKMPLQTSPHYNYTNKETWLYIYIWRQEVRLLSYTKFSEFLHHKRMVCRAEEAMKQREKVNRGKEDDREKKKQLITHFNKDKSCRFKRSTCNLDHDGASSAIYLLACIACSSFSYHL